jgi:hypothetical protein
VGVGFRLIHAVSQETAVSSPVAGRGWMPVKSEVAFSAENAPGPRWGLTLQIVGRLLQLKGWD